MTFMFAIATLPGPAPAQGGAHTPWTLTCEQTRGFHDGDTFACVPAVSSRGPFVVRTAGDDTPETGQAHWRVARDRLRGAAGPGTEVTCYKTDRYGRELCRVRAVDGTDVVELMIREGLAWHSVHYAPEQAVEERRRYQAAEKRARDAGAGLWSNTDPQPPWECRRSKERRERCR